jgi:hypothetical protein
MKRPFETVAILGAILAFFIAADRVTASSIAAVEAMPVGAAAVLDNNPIVTAVLADNWFLVNDGTGSMAAFGSHLCGLTVGDNVRVMGTYSFFAQINELINIFTEIISVGNPVPPPITATISQMNVPTLPLSLAGYLIDLNGVRISGAPATFGYDSFSATITESGGNSMALFYEPVLSGGYDTSFRNLFGLAVPAGPVNMTGIVSESLSGDDMIAEFSPLTMSSVPEPPTLTLAGIGAVFLLAAIRRHGGVNRSNRDIETKGPARRAALFRGADERPGGRGPGNLPPAALIGSAATRGPGCAARWANAPGPDARSSRRGGNS